MAWYLNRTGQPEGPYEEGQILQMIQGGQLTSGHVCQQGGNQWIPLQQVPQFAQAMQGGGQAAPPGVGYPQAPGYPQPPGYPPAGPGYAQPAGGPQAGAMPQAGAPPKKKGAPIGIILAVVGILVVAGAAVGLYFMFRGVSSNLSASVPKDTQVFVEIPSVPGALGSFVGMGIIDGDEIDAEKLGGDVKEGLAEAFDIDEEDAADILESVESVAVAVRALDDKPEQATLVSFSGTDGLDALLTSDRFAEEGDVAGGKQYAVERLDVDYKDMKDWKEARKSFASLSYEADSKREILVWFADAKLLVIGHPDFIEDIGGVVVNGEAALSGEDKWGKASYPSSSSGIAFVDSALLDEIDDDKGEELVNNYLKDVGPFTGSVRFTDAGVVFNVSGEMRGKKVTPENAFPPAVALDLHERLPKETVAYLAFSTHTDLSGKDLTTRLLDELEDVDESAAKGMDKGLDEMEDELGLTLADVFDAIGDEMAFAVALKSGVEIDKDKKPEEWIEEAGIGILIKVSDHDKAQSLVDALKEKAFEEGPLKEMYELSDEGDGFDADPKGDAKEMSPVVRVRLSEEHLLIAAGGLAERFTDALEGSDTLGDDAGHANALEALEGEPHILFWADTGRVGKALLDFAKNDDDLNDELEEMEEELGISVGAIRLEGEERLTSALAFGLEDDGERWLFRFETLNASALGIGAAAYQMFKPRPSLDEPADFEEGEGGNLKKTGVKECDEYFEAIEKCKGKMPAASYESIKKSADQMRETMDKLPASARSSMATGCENAKKSVESVCR